MTVTKASTTPPPPSSWKKSNLALIGSDLDHKVKAATAKHEGQWKELQEAVQRKDNTTTTTTLIFRMEDFHVVPWPKNKYGQFHVGDSYIIFHKRPKVKQGAGDDVAAAAATTTIITEWEYHLHIWIGQESSADEYGTAAYKMVEADEIVGGAAVQHREVQGHESELFISYFAPRALQYLQGGVASGFHHVEATVEEPHLYRIKGTQKAMSLTQVKHVTTSSLCEGDSFILYASNAKVWLWIGKYSNPDERYRANALAESMCVENNVVVLDQAAGSDVDDEEFWTYLGGKDNGHIKTLQEEEEQNNEGNHSNKGSGGGDSDEAVVEFIPTLYRLVAGAAQEDDAAAADVILVASATPIKIGFGRAVPRIPKSLLDDSDIFLLDTGWEIYVWVGRKASREERLAAMNLAHTYTQGNGRTMHLPISFVKPGYETSKFKDFFYDDKH